MSGLAQYEFGAWVAGVAAGPTAALFGLADGTVVLLPWGGEPRRLEAHGGSTLTVVADPLRASGGDFLSGGDDGRLMRLGTDGVLEPLAAWPGRWVERAAVSPDGVIAAAVGREVRLLRLPSGEPERTLEHPGGVADLAFSGDGGTLAVSHPGGLTFWAVLEPDQEPRRVERPGPHLTLAFSPEGRYLATAHGEKRVHVLDVLHAKTTDLGGYDAKPAALSWSASLSWLLTGGAGAFVAWPFPAEGEVPEDPDPVVFGRFEEAVLTAVAAHPLLPVAAGGFSQGSVFLADLARQAPVPVLHAKAKTTALAWSPDGRYLVGGFDDGQAFLLDLGDWLRRG